MKTKVFKMLKTASSAILYLIGVLVILFIAKTYLPTPVYVTIWVVLFLLFIFKLSYPDSHYWSYTLILEGRTIKGVVKTSKDKFPLKAIEMKYPELDKTIIINVYEVAKEDYFYFLDRNYKEKVEESK